MKTLPELSTHESSTNDCPDTLRGTNPYVFLVGSPRSGTTMLKRMVNAHPSLAITRETHWIPRFYEKRKGVTAEGRVNEKLIDLLFEHHRFDQMKIKRKALLKIVREQPDLTYANLVGLIFDHFGRRKNKPLVGDKTPTYVRKLPVLHELWPAARFVHLIRDGRDVWLSMRQWRMAAKSAGKFPTWNVDPLVTTALWWKALVGMGCRDGRAIGNGQYCELKYEQLVAQPEIECKKLAHFLDLPHVEAMERYYEGRSQTDEQLSTNAAWLPPTPGRRDWRTQLEAKDLEKFEAAAGDLLDQLGYERRCSTISNKVQDQVENIKRQFAESVDGRWRLPEPW
ncbi:MAG: sulfotransferase [Planctomycetes bacterium]|nr:sulfotransferase [Planctomycetota bacterium]